MPGISQGGNLNLPGIALNFATCTYDSARFPTEVLSLDRTFVFARIPFSRTARSVFRSTSFFPSWKTIDREGHALVKIEARREREGERL